MVPLVYSPGYNVTACGLERRHPFDSIKSQRIRDELIRQGLRRAGDFARPAFPTVGELKLVHTPEYLRSLNNPLVLARILEVAVVAFLPSLFTQWRVLRPMRLATGGTVLACRLALERGLAVNLGGGFHHASGSRGGGFCVYADVPLALALLHRQGKLKSALVVDTDAHQGDGTADAIRDWPWAHIVDFFDRSIYPPKVREDIPVPLEPGTGGREYLERLADVLPGALSQFRPDLVVYNAGSDVLGTDRLSRLMLTPSEMAERDLFVVTEARRAGVPLAMVLSGGYGPLSWEAHAASLEGILARFDGEV
jgi:histone deacetylase 11